MPSIVELFQASDNPTIFRYFYTHRSNLPLPLDYLMLINIDTLPFSVSWKVHHLSRKAINPRSERSKIHDHTHRILHEPTPTCITVHSTSLWPSLSWQAGPLHTHIYIYPYPSPVPRRWYQANLYHIPHSCVCGWVWRESYNLTYIHTFCTHPTEWTPHNFTRSTPGCMMTLHCLIHAIRCSFSWVTVTE